MYAALGVSCMSPEHFHFKVWDKKTIINRIDVVTGFLLILSMCMVQSCHQCLCLFSSWWEEKFSPREINQVSTLVSLVVGNAYYQSGRWSSWANMWEMHTITAYKASNSIFKFQQHQSESGIVLTHCHHSSSQHTMQPMNFDFS